MFQMTPTPAATTELAASVIISTRNRVDKLVRTLRAFEAQQTLLPWELVIVDNDSTDQTPNTLGDFVSRTRLRVRVGTERRRGVSNAKNLALDLCAGNVLIFTDDDCYPAPDYVASWVEVFERTDLDFAAGRIELYDQSHLPMTIRTDVAPDRLPPRSLLPRGYLQGANCACRRAVIQAVGRFDPLFGPGCEYLSGDDTEFFQRAINLGFAGGYQPEPVVFHDHGRVAKDLPELLWTYNVAYGAALMKATLTNPKAVARRAAGKDDWSSTSWLKQLYWDLRSRGIGVAGPYWSKRLLQSAVGAARFARNALLRRHRDYW
jgi:glycosyltransferase involved in cell wall biosynthesis